MVNRRIGTVFVELDLDPSRYTKSQQRLYKDATSTSLSIEANFKKLGIKSAAEFDLMRAKITNSYNMIKNSAQSTANDIVRAEKAKNDQLKAINNQQFGEHTSFLSKLKANWIAASAAIVAAWIAVNKVISKISGIVLATARYETLGVVVRTVGNNAGYTGEQMERFAKGLEETGISMTGARQSLTRMAQAQLDLSKSADLARVAQDAAVIGAMNSTEAFEQMVYGIQSANVRVLRTIGINVSFEQSYQKVAAQLGRTTDSFDEAEKAAIRMQAVLDAGKRIAGTYEAAMETAGKQMYSLERHFENLKVLAGTALTPAFAEVIEMITGSVKSLNEELSGENIKKIHAWGVNLRVTLIDIELAFISIREVVKDLFNIMHKINIPLRVIETVLSVYKKAYEYVSGSEEKGKSTVRMSIEEAILQNKINVLKAKKLELEYSLTEEGQKQAKAKQDEIEAIRIALAEEGKRQDAEAAARSKRDEDMRKAKEEMTKEGLKATDAAIKDMQKGMEESIKLGLKYQEEMSAERMKLINKETDYSISEMQRGVNQSIQLMQEEMRYEKELLDQRVENYNNAYSIMMQMANVIGGGAGQGMGMFASGMKGITDIAMEEDQYSKQYEAALEHYERMRELYKDDADYELKMNLQKDKLLAAQERMYSRQRVEIARSTAGMMAGIMLAMYNFTDQKHKEYFELYKAFSIAEAMINTYKAAIAAYQSMVGIPIVGPALGAIAAAVAVAFGMMQVRAIASMQPGGGPGTVSAVPSSGGYSYKSPSEPQWEQTSTQEKEEQRPLVINIHVLGNLVDHDKFAREMVEPLRRAIGEGVH